jgi:hypothetical protein
MIYRRRINTYVWHFSPECPMWPEESFEERTERPANDPLDLCSECSALLIRDGRDTLKRPDEN